MAAARPHSARPGRLIEPRSAKHSSATSSAIAASAHAAGAWRASASSGGRAAERAARASSSPAPTPPDRGGGEDDLDAVVLLEPAGDLDGDHRPRQRGREHAGERVQRGRVRAGGDRVAQPPRGDSSRAGGSPRTRAGTTPSRPSGVCGGNGAGSVTGGVAPMISGISAAKAATASVTIRASVAPNGARWLGRGVAMGRQPYSWPASPPCDHSKHGKPNDSGRRHRLRRPLATATDRS